MNQAVIRIKNKEIFVNQEFAPFLTLFKWHINNMGYAMAKVCNDTILMHRLILNARNGYVVDHINGNKLDNRRENLRECLHQQNSCNTPNRKKYRGIVFDPRDSKWSARIQVNGKGISFAYNKNPIISAKAWDAAARFHYGEFARTNFSGTESISAYEQKNTIRNIKNKTSKYRGVRKTQSSNWQVLFMKKHCGVFKTQEEAAKKYNEIAFATLGEKAIINII